MRVTTLAPVLLTGSLSQARGRTKLLKRFPNVFVLGVFAASVASSLFQQLLYFVGEGAVPCSLLPSTKLLLKRELADQHKVSAVSALVTVAPVRYPSIQTQAGVSSSQREVMTRGNNRACYRRTNAPGHC